MFHRVLRPSATAVKTLVGIIQLSTPSLLTISGSIQVLMRLSVLITLSPSFIQLWILRILKRRIPHALRITSCFRLQVMRLQEHQISFY